MFDSLLPHELQNARLSFPSLSPRVCSNSCPLSWWCHPTTSYCPPVLPHPQSFPASGSFPMSQLFVSGGQSIGASASVLPMNIQDWFPLGLAGFISLLFRGLPRVFSSTTIQKNHRVGGLAPSPEHKGPPRAFSNTTVWKHHRGGWSAPPQLLLLSHVSRVQLCATPQTAAHQAPPSLGFSRQKHWSGVPFPSPVQESEKWKWSCSVVSDS